MTSTRSSRKQRTPSGLGRVLWWELRSSRIIGIIYCVATIGILSGSMLLSVLSNESYYTNMANWDGQTAEMVRRNFASAVTSDYLGAISIGMVSLLWVYCLLFCGCAFSYMHARRSTDLYHSLPIRRRPMLLGKYLACVVMLVLPMAVATGINQGICASRDLGISALWLWSTFGDMALVSVACLTMSLFFMVVSGTLPGALLSILTVAVGWPAAVGVVNTTMQLFLPGYISVIPDAGYTLFSPFAALTRKVGGNMSIFSFLFGYDDYYEEGYEMVEAVRAFPWENLWWIGFIVVVLLASVFYYGRRKSEAAENYFSFPLVRSIVRSLLTILVGLGAGAIVGQMLDSNAAYFIAIAVGGVCAHTVYQVMLTHSFRGFWKTIPALLLTAAVTGGFLYALHTGGLGYVQRIPNAEDVVRVEFELPGVAGSDSALSYLSQRTGFSIYDRNEEYLMELSPVFEETGDISALENYHRTLLEQRYPGPYLPFGKNEMFSGQNFEAAYTLKNGSTIKRQYWYYVLDSDTQLLSALTKVQSLDTTQSYCTYYTANPSHIEDVNETEYSDLQEYDALNRELTDEEKELVWNTFREELFGDTFSDSPELMSQEELDWYLENGDASTPWEGDTKEDDEGYHHFYISMKNIPVKDVTPEMEALLNHRLQPEEMEQADSISGYTYLVPECCTKTRQLIHDLTKDYGEWYYYGDDAADAVEE